MYWHKNLGHLYISEAVFEPMIHMCGRSKAVWTLNLVVTKHRTVPWIKVYFTLNTSNIGFLIITGTSCQTILTKVSLLNDHIRYHFLTARGITHENTWYHLWTQVISFLITRGITSYDRTWYHSGQHVVSLLTTTRGITSYDHGWCNSWQRGITSYDRTWYHLSPFVVSLMTVHGRAL